jgi:hypothetical protein
VDPRDLSWERTLRNPYLVPTVTPDSMLPVPTRPDMHAAGEPQPPPMAVAVPGRLSHEQAGDRPESSLALPPKQGQVKKTEKDHRPDASGQSPSPVRDVPTNTYSTFTRFWTRHVTPVVQFEACRDHLGTCCNHLCLYLCFASVNFTCMDSKVDDRRAQPEVLSAAASTPCMQQLDGRSNAEQITSQDYGPGQRR